MNIIEIKYETKYICRQIGRVIGRRYNIRPDLQPDVVPEITGYMYKETATGLFRSWKINEIHFGIMSIVNELRIADIEMIFKKTNMSRDEFKKVLYECVVYGLLCENAILFKDGKMLKLYMVDTGGIFALEEAGKHYIKVPFTIGIDERINIYRRNIFITEKGANSSEVGHINFFENIVDANFEKYKNSILLLDIEIANILGLKSAIEQFLSGIVRPFNINIFDLSSKTFIDNI